MSSSSRIGEGNPCAGRRRWEEELLAWWGEGGLVMEKLLSVELGGLFVFVKLSKATVTELTFLREELR